MPSHKHKKKKKCHKKSKRKSKSSSDNEEVMWNLSLSESDWETGESNNEDTLTSLVRKSYMNHLEQVIIENVTIGMETTGQYSDTVQELARKWTKSLEEKALRASMVSDIYRKNMVSYIKSIKARTSLRRVYFDDHALSKVKVPLNKETQTEDKQFCEVGIQAECVQPKTVCVAETQTVTPLPSLLKLPLPKCLPVSPPSKPYDPAINFSDSSVSSSEQPNTSAINDTCKITSTTDLFTIIQPEEEPCRNKPHTSAISTTCNDNDTLKTINNHVEDIKSNSSRSVTKDVPVKKDLDARLSAMGWLKDTEVELESEKPKKSNWYAEETAQKCNLTRVLLRMTTNQRERAFSKIKELFGEENGPLAELSEENVGICRKRIASIVVMELTSMYQTKRIASRYLFKLVAKKITKALMNQSYAPDSRTIRLKVKEVFRNGHVVMSEADCP